MMNQPGTAKRWWSAPAPVLQGAVYRVTCACGRVSSGERGKDFQTLPCPGCRAELFILPQSPFPAVSPALAPPTGPTPAPPPRRTLPWTWLVAGASLLAVTVAGLVLLLNPTGDRSSLRQPDLVPVREGGPPDPTAQFKSHRETAEQHLAQGNFLLALAELDSALDLLKHQPKLCSTDEQLSLTQLHKQTELLGDLSAESLEEILRHAAGRQDKEWEADFRRRFQKRAFVFDCELTQTTAGEYRLSYLIVLREEKARLQLDQAPVLRLLPAEGPRRVIFGGRLASVRRERPGFWAVRFDPESVLLFTEPAGLAVCCPALGEPSALDVFSQQRRWLAAGRGGAVVLAEK